VAGLEHLGVLVRATHEHWDGGGYPDGLAGDDIPLEARIVTVADAYDAMVSDRSYRRALSVPEACRRVEADAGRQFDPLIAAALLEVVGP
jgi:HD-GYP domain-containing protein (c-di-GMP phosphodiesterase class II)